MAGRTRRERARSARGRGAALSGRTRGPGRPGLGEALLSPEGVLGLQSWAGNRAVTQLLAQRQAADPQHAHSEAEADVVGARLGPALADLTVPQPGPLPPDVRAVAERHLGVDLHGARIRTTAAPEPDVGDARGWARRDEVGARPGGFDGRAGLVRLGHELTHVAQQRSGRGAPVQHQDPTDQLTSIRLADSPRLQSAFRNRPLLKRGDPDRDAVRRVQETLLDDGFTLPRSTKHHTDRLGGETLDGIFGGETFSAIQAFQRKHSLSPDGIVGHDTLAALDGVAGRRTPSSEPLAGPLAEGQETRAFSREHYIEMWEAKHGRRMTGEERRDLARGCIGITNLNLASGSVNPPLHLSFSTFSKARAVQQALDKVLESATAIDQMGPDAAEHPELANLKNVVASLPTTGTPDQWRAVIFSKRFFSRQSGTWDERLHGDPDAFLPDEETGQVDMTGYQYEGRADADRGRDRYMVNFDYGWWDEETDSWWHANHAEPDMEVYQSTLEHYSRPLQNFDRQVFSVAFARKI